MSKKEGNLALSVDTFDESWYKAIREPKRARCEECYVTEIKKWNLSMLSVFFFWQNIIIIVDWVTQNVPALAPAVAASVKESDTRVEQNERRSVNH